MVWILERRGVGDRLMEIFIVISAWLLFTFFIVIKLLEGWDDVFLIFLWNVGNAVIWISYLVWVYWEYSKNTL